MTLFIKIPILPNNPIYSPEDFAARFVELTNQRFILGNLINDNETHYMGKSNILTIEQADILKSEFPMMQYFTEWPGANDWVTNPGEL